MPSGTIVGWFVGCLLQIALTQFVPAQIQDVASSGRRMEITREAGKLLGEQYVVPADHPIKFAEDAGFLRPVNRAIYRHGTDYVVVLFFADDGSLARIHLTPEALLHSDSWTDVPPTVELTDHDMTWLLGVADALQVVGKQLPPEEMPPFCFQSGKNHYCAEPHENASIRSYREDQQRGTEGTWETVMRRITVSYKRVVSGTIADFATGKTGEPLVRIGSNRYEVGQGKIADPNLADKLKPGGLVQLETTGCTGSERACPAMVVVEHKTQ
jgi:hypothetical protein